MTEIEDKSTLASALDDADPEIRRQAAFALAKLADQRAINPLVHMLSDEAEQDEVRVHAAQAFGPLGKSAFNELLNLLPDEAHDIAWKTPDLAVRALGAIAED